MAVLVSDIFQRVRDALIDTNPNVELQRYPDSELIRYFNDAGKAIVRDKPSANPIHAHGYELQVGTFQTAPEDALMILDIPRNTGGNAVRLIERTVLDDSAPNWHMMEPSASIMHYSKEPHDPVHFYVYPPAADGARVDLVYAAPPADVSDVEDTFPLSSVYVTTYTDYILYRCYMKDADFAANHQLAMQYLQSYAQQLGVQLQMQMYAPKHKDPHLSGDN